MEKENNTDKIYKSLRTGKLLITITNVIAALLFFITYFLTSENWYLILGIALTLVCILTVWLIKKLENKLNSINKKG